MDTTVSVDQSASAGTYGGEERLCTMVSSFSSPPILEPVAGGTAQDDCTRFTVENG